MAAEMINIAVDLQVYKAIEAKRVSFNQSHNDILKQWVSHAPLVGSSDTLKNTPTSQFTRKRVTGSYDFVLLGQAYHTPSLKEAYLKCLRLLSERFPTLLTSLSKVKYTNRRIISRDPLDLYLKSPHLAEKHAEKLTGDWWIDLNLNQRQVELRLDTACQNAGLKFGSDLQLDFPEG